ncbi:hypothetical protein B9X63_14565, partial [Acinetobacter baumannii]
TMGVQNNSSKYCWIGRVFDLIYYSPFNNNEIYKNIKLIKYLFCFYNLENLLLPFCCNLKLPFQKVNKTNTIAYLYSSKIHFSKSEL